MLLCYSTGIDISLKKFDACIVSLDSEHNLKVVASRKFDNAPNGFEHFYKWVIKNRKLKNIPMRFCMEATGVYHENLAMFLHTKDCQLSIILANKASKFLASLGHKSKTDSIDAKGLAQMGAERKLKLWNPPAKFYADLRSMTRYHQMLQEHKTTLTNQLHANEHSALDHSFVNQQLKNQIQSTKSNIKITEQQITKHIDSKTEVRLVVDNICLIKGVAQHTVAVVIAETFGFELFESAKQLLSYCGYDVVQNQSGNKNGKTKISKKGNSRIRRALHFPALNAVRPDQPAFYNLWHRTFEKHFIKMKSYVAVQKKLLTTIYALWKNQQQFDPEYQSKTINLTLEKVVPM